MMRVGPLSSRHIDCQVRRRDLWCLSLKKLVCDMKVLLQEKESRGCHRKRQMCVEAEEKRNSLACSVQH